ncbi:unnamed protein product [Cuscuta epithymum]|uniref:Uncharacterized protein n=1 Tax=Cuscuta epithymum TaxID=186058 RepID=A0AAV0CGT9_9ASTE|nr:unnamed protein product [Cuscuta epithymum]CAH9132851.1 unnamed protein product [Cuscuta epithymum]
MDSSISKALLQVDIIHSVSLNNSLEVTAIEDTTRSDPGLDPSLAIIKDFFQNAMTNGVDSLSHFLLKEFRIILTDSLQNQKLSTEEKKTSMCANSGDVFTGNHYSEDFVSEGVFDEPLCTHSGMIF